MAEGPEECKGRSYPSRNAGKAEKPRGKITGRRASRVGKRETIAAINWNDGILTDIGEYYNRSLTLLGLVDVGIKKGSTAASGSPFADAACGSKEQTILYFSILVLFTDVNLELNIHEPHHWNKF